MDLGQPNSLLIRQVRIMGKSCISLLYSRVYRLTHGMIWGTKLTVLHVLAGSCRFLGSSWGYNKLYFHVEFNCLTIFIILIFIFHRVNDIVEKTSFLKRLVHDVGGQKWESSWADSSRNLKFPICISN